MLLEQLAHPLQVLTRGPRDVPERQQTMRATIGWSYALLSAAEQRLFRRLAVFVGGCTMEAIAAVGEDTAHGGNAEQEPGAGACAGSDRRGHGAMPRPSLADPLPPLLDQVASLVDKSLLRADEASGELRFTMLELIRGFALGQLELSGEAETLRQRHATYYLGLAERLEVAAMGPHQAAAMDALEQDHDNLGVALAWSRGQAGDAELGLRLAAALWWSWGQRGYVSEGRRWLEDALTAAPATAPTRARAKALYRAGILAWYQGEHAHAVALSNESLALSQELGDPQGVAWALHNLGRVAFLQGDYQQAGPLLEQSLARFREVGDTWGTPWSLDVLGQVVMAQGDHARAVVLWEESLRLRQRIGDVQGIPWTLNNLGDVAAAQGDFVRARTLLEESLARVREQGIKRPIPWVLDNLGQVAAAQGDYARAWMLLDESLALLRERGEKTGVAQVLSHQGGVALDQGDHPRAAMLLAESLALSRELGAKHNIARVLQQLGRVAHIKGDDVRAPRLMAAGDALREALGASLRLIVRMQHETVRAATRARMGETAWAESQAMPLEQALAYALDAAGPE
jgi:tetratricopeptide (TPR) repeat protein